jgi:glycosyl transferase family 25
MQSYYINLDRSGGRRAAMEQQIAILGLNCTRIAAVDGALLDAKNTPPLTTRATDIWKMSAGEIGCAMSHIMAWRMIVTQTDRYAAVFEDDILFSSNAPLFLKDDSWIPPETACIKLDLSGIDAYHRDPLTLPIAAFRLTRPITSLGSTGGYILSREAAQMLLDRTQTLDGAVDNLMFGVSEPEFLDLNYRQLIPAICTQRLALVRDAALPTDVYESTIDHGGPWRGRTRKRTGLPKLWQKIKRPLQKLISWAKHRALRGHMKRRFNASRIIIPFDDTQPPPKT